MSYILNSPEAQSTKKAIKRFSKGFPIDGQKIKGTFTIVRYRHYSCYDEVDVVFDGKLFCRMGYKSEWYDSSVSQNPRVSKIRLNRCLRKLIFSKVQFYSKFFGINLNHYSQIKSIKWKF